MLEISNYSTIWVCRLLVISLGTVEGEVGVEQVAVVILGAHTMEDGDMATVVEDVIKWYQPVINRVIMKICPLSQGFCC